MAVIAFVGPSGTGNSHHAIGVAYQNKCDAIIDDGLLIKGPKILAGISAKNEENRIQAVKRAIFTDDEHAKEVKDALGRSNIKRLLIIATSDNMIGKIIRKLELPDPLKTVYIHEVATKQEIKKARHARLEEGKHIVPVPSVELKSHFTGYFADLPYNIFSHQRKDSVGGDRSIVRPAFSFYGKLFISNKVIEDIITLAAEDFTGLYKVTDITLRRRSDSSKGLVLVIEVILYYGVSIFSVSKLLQQKIKDRIESMTAMKVKNVNINVRSLALKKK